MTARAAAALAGPRADAGFAGDVRDGLCGRPKRLPARYFYDDLGSTLFDAICLLPWYEVTRAEVRLLEEHAPSIVRAAAPAFVAELGPGSGEKLATSWRARRSASGPTAFHLIDVSPAALAAASRLVSDVTRARVTSDAGTYESGPAAVAAPPSFARRRAGPVSRVEHRQLRSP